MAELACLCVVAPVTFALQAVRQNDLARHACVLGDQLDGLLKGGLEDRAAGGLVAGEVQTLESSAGP